MPHGVERKAVARRFLELDWDFTASFSESKFSAIHWHPGRFPSQIPAICIDRYSPMGGTVLDPFAGSGTVAVEAQRLGRPSISIELNPVSAAIIRAKTSSRSAADLRKDFQPVFMRLLSDWLHIKQAEIPSSVQAEKWYAPNTLRGLRRIWNIANDCEGEKGEILRFLFSSILNKACREYRHFGYVCDNTQPPADAKGISEEEVRDRFVDAISKLLDAYEHRDAAIREAGISNIPWANVSNSDALSSLRLMEDHSCDTFVTSPPYLGVVDYAKSQRLSMEWFETEIESVRRREIGARSKRHRTTAFGDYISEVTSVFAEMHRVLKIGSVGVLVIGQSSSREPYIQKLLLEIEKCGYAIWADANRSIPVQRVLKPSLLKEQVILLARK